MSRFVWGIDLSETEFFDQLTDITMQNTSIKSFLATSCTESVRVKAEYDEKADWKLFKNIEGTLHGLGDLCVNNICTTFVHLYIRTFSSFRFQTAFISKSKFEKWPNKFVIEAIVQDMASSATGNSFGSTKSLIIRYWKHRNQSNLIGISTKQQKLLSSCRKNWFSPLPKFPSAFEAVAARSHRASASN